MGGKLPYHQSRGNRWIGLEDHQGHQVTPFSRSKDASKNAGFLEKKKRKLKIPALQYSRVPSVQTHGFGTWGRTFEKTSKRGRCLSRDCSSDRTQIQLRQQLNMVKDRVRGGQGARGEWKRREAPVGVSELRKGGEIRYPPKNRIKNEKTEKKKKERPSRKLRRKV